MNIPLASPEAVGPKIPILDHMIRTEQAARAMAIGPNITLKEGDPALAFTAATNGGSSVALNDFLGKHVVLFFYPKDDTPG